MNTNSNNVVKISGTINNDNIRYDHEIAGEKFYRFYIESPRLSGTIDKIKCIISDRIINIEDLKQAADHLVAVIDGEYRSYRYRQETENGIKNHTDYFVFTKDISFVENDENINHVNQLTIIGQISKGPFYRTTPLGRDITDIVVKVDRNYGKNDYIPVIVWGRNAKYAAHNLFYGYNVKINGRIQSRPYTKVLESGEVVTKIAYDISASAISIYNDENEDKNTNE